MSSQMEKWNFRVSSGMCGRCGKFPLDLSISICMCASCMEKVRKYRDSNRHNIREYSNSWAHNHRENMNKSKEKWRRSKGISPKQKIYSNEELLEHSKNWRQSEAGKLSAKKYSETHTKEIRKYQNEWTQKNIERLREYKKVWRELNREKTREYSKKWRNKNPDKVVETSEIRRSRIEKALGSFTDLEWKNLKEKFGNKCLCCGKSNVKLEADHVVPLSKGGTNYIDNIQPLCHSCNMKKYTKIIDYRGGYFEFLSV